jgi:uncharacterized iron-regulated protein
MACFLVDSRYPDSSPEGEPMPERSCRFLCLPIALFGVRRFIAAFCARNTSSWPKAATTMLAWCPRRTPKARFSPLARKAGKTFCVPVLLMVLVGDVHAEPQRATLWLDLYGGEPVPYDEVLADLAEARIVYLGERHTVGRHHDIEARIVEDLGQRNLSLVVALEQMESSRQPALDRFNRRELDFDQLAEATNWAERWPNYRQYRPRLEAARKHGGAVIGLNAASETIRRVARAGGVAKLDPNQRKALPAEMQLHDPLYEKLLGLEMMGHVAATPERLRPMVEAQITRDEAMAATLADYLKSEQGRRRTAVVIAGAGHVAYGLGTPERVRRRMPGVKDRIVIFSESGDVELSAEDKAAAQPVEITHEQLRAINRPIADYLHVTEPKQTEEKN